MVGTSALRPRKDQRVAMPAARKVSEMASRLVASELRGKTYVGSNPTPSATKTSQGRRLRICKGIYLSEPGIVPPA